MNKTEENIKLIQEFFAGRGIAISVRNDGDYYTVIINGEEWITGKAKEPIEVVLGYLEGYLSGYGKGVESTTKHIEQSFPFIFGEKK